MKALVIPAVLNEQVRVDDIDGDDVGTLQRIVGGYIEGLSVPDHDAHAYVNEDGRRLALPLNVRASDLLHKTVVGDVVVLGNGRIPDEDDVPDSVLADVGLT
jgi:hypothetical protein